MISLIKKTTVFTLISLIIIACSENATEHTNEPETPEYNENNNLVNYKIILTADSLITLDKTLTLKVWIGDENIQILKKPSLNVDSTKVPKSAGKYAKISPIAPDFEILNIKNNNCYKIHESGSEVRFLLKPKLKGSFYISADVFFYEGENCSGEAVPKICETLSVSVSIDEDLELEKKLDDLGNSFWQELLKFWKGILAICFGGILFLIRKKLKIK